jgi:glycosyltransferase involved in cell wall biosynthesis
MQLLIDLRKARDSGIGTYIRSVVPRVLDRLELKSVGALVANESADAHDYLRGHRLELIRLPAKSLSLREQWTLRYAIRGSRLFWATSLAHPLRSATPIAAMVHDVLQLALTGPAAGSALVRTASRVFLANLRRHARLLLFNSEFTRSEFARHVGPSNADQRVAPLGVEPRWFDPPVIAEPPLPTRPYFICVGNVRPHKNLRMLLAAFEQVAGELPHLLVVIGQHAGFRTGDESMVASMKALGERVRFLGFLDDAQLHRWVAGADAMIFPSLYEGFGLPALEAMAAKSMLLASNAGALPEVCGDAARYFDPRSVDGLAALLREQAFMDASQREAWTLRGRERARQFTWERTANITADALDRLLHTLP